MKILLAGYWQYGHHEQPFAQALEKEGVMVLACGWSDVFHFEILGKVPPYSPLFLRRVQNSLLIGPAVDRINNRVIEAARQFQPDVLWTYNAHVLYPTTVKRLKSLLPDTFFVQYTNDNPFSPHVKKYRWRYVKRAVPLYDLNFVFREANLKDFRQAGSPEVELLRAYYIPAEHYPMTQVPAAYQADVAFAGHYENDGRADHLEAILQAGFHLKLYGANWHKARLSPESLLRQMFPVRTAFGSAYREAICGAKIALCFLSHLNQDTYTRRNFEIPAMRTFLLSQYSDDLATLFKEGEEAEFFRSKEEMLDKIAYYLRHDEQRQRIAQRGYERVQRDGHDVQSRARQALQTIHRLMSQRRQQHP